MKKRVIKDYNKLPDEVKQAIKDKYPDGGLVQDLMLIKNSKGEDMTVFSFETEQVNYLVRLPDEAIEDFELDDDFTGEDLFDDE